MSKKWISFPDDENEVVRKDALMAAWKALQPLRDTDDIEENIAIKIILSAFVAVKTVDDEASKTFKDKHPGRDVYGPDVKANYIVATALSFFNLDESAIADVHPYSIQGAFVVDFASALKALDAYQDVLHSLDDTSNFYGADLAQDLLDKME